MEKEFLIYLYEQIEKLDDVDDCDGALHVLKVIDLYLLWTRTGIASDELSDVLYGEKSFDELPQESSIFYKDKIDAFENLLCEINAQKVND